MEIDEVVVAEVELKYCERCGALWLREVGDSEVYCPICAPVVAELPVGRKRKGAERVTVHSDVDLKAAFEELAMLCVEGGNA
jgi:uncharacterized Zn finger protein (UPF0148 family)